MLFLAVLLLLAACADTDSQRAVQQAFSDPYAYCAAVRQIDTPDARYTGASLPDALFADYLAAAGLNAPADYPDSFKKMTIWRCMEGEVYVCNYGANIPCDSKANTDKQPTQAMQDFCTQSPDEPVIPMSVTGHNVIYDWHCVQGKPEIQGQISDVDAAGYPVNFWQLVEPNP
jgi:hypothetical protein